MTINFGTYEGDQQEIDFVKYFNMNKIKYEDFIDMFKVPLESIWLIRVTTKQMSSLSNKKVFTRSDAYLIKTLDSNIMKIICDSNGYLDENLLEQENIKYNYLPYSGISIKLSTSTRYQILKTGPTSFSKLFGSYELGAGASLFCMRENELVKNKELILGWNTTQEKMNNYFGFMFSHSVDFEKNKEACNSIKKYSFRKITELINNSKELQEKIFNGKSLYKEPYTAWYFTQGETLQKLEFLPFSVTTGSGRSRGDYTIVLKPV